MLGGRTLQLRRGGSRQSRPDFNVVELAEDGLQGGKPRQIGAGRLGVVEQGSEELCEIAKPLRNDAQAMQAPDGRLCNVLAVPRKLAHVPGEAVTREVAGARLIARIRAMSRFERMHRKDQTLEARGVEHAAQSRMISFAQ